MMVICGMILQQCPLMFGVGGCATGADGEHRGQVIGPAAQFLHDGCGVGIADHGHQADPFALGRLQHGARIELRLGVVQHRRSDPDSTAENAVHISGGVHQRRDREPGGPACAHLLVDLARPRRDRPRSSRTRRYRPGATAHPWGARWCRRYRSSAGHPATVPTSQSESPCGQCVFEADRSRAVRPPSLPSSTRDEQIAPAGSTSANLAPSERW